MNEENNNTAVEPTVDTNNENKEVATTPVVENSAKLQQTEEKKETSESTPNAPVQAVNVVPQENKVEQPAPQPQPIPQPADANAVMPQPVPQPATPAPAPQPVKENSSDSIIPSVAPQQAAPTPPSGEEIKEAPALDPIANNPQVPQQPMVPKATTEATVAPSNPLQTQMDTNIGFVAVGENLKKKKNGKLIALIVLLVVAGLGALGYFVIYPYVVKKTLKPEEVYANVIDNAFKGVNNTINLVSHSKATYNAEFEIESNMEQLKDLTGYIYTANFGIDPQNQNIQAGLRIKDKDNQEHSANIYVKGERQYLRLSSYRDLIYYPTYSDYKKLWEGMYNFFDDINQEDSAYLTSTISQSIKNSIVKNKLTKEDASITINGKTYKVLNSKYAIDNDVVSTMFSSIVDSLKNDDKFIEIIAKYAGLPKEDIANFFENIKVPEEILEDGKVIYFNVYTYSVKNKFVGYSINVDDDSLHYYAMDDYFEYKLNSTSENIETGKEEVVDANVIGKKVDGKTNVVVTIGEEEVAKFIVDAWDENNKIFSYEIKNGDDKVTGNVKLVIDTNDSRSKLDFSTSINVDKDYIKLSLNLTNDWTSEVSNINAATAVDLNDEQIKVKLQEFITTLKDTPLAKLFTTESGDFDLSIVEYRLDNEDDVVVDPTEENIVIIQKEENPTDNQVTDEIQNNEVNQEANEN